MILYTKLDCEPCELLHNWIKESGKKIKIKELKKIDNELMEQVEDGYVKFNSDVKEFPALKIENSFLVGLEGIKSYLEKGYLYEAKECPYYQNKCIEKKCELFVMINKNGIIEGGCAIKINTMIALESLKGK